MTIKRSISPFPRFSLTTNSYRWLHEEGWEDSERLQFAAVRSRATLQLALPPKMVRPGKRALPSPGIVGRWLLMAAEVNASKQPWLWVELHRFPKIFSTYHFHVGFAGVDAPDQAPEWLAQALHRLVSAVFIVGRADLVQIFPNGSLINALTQTLTGEERSVFSWPTDLDLLEPDAAKPSVTTVKTASPETWWASPDGKLDREELEYLEKHYRDPPPKRPKRKRGLFGFPLREKNCC